MELYSINKTLSALIEADNDTVINSETGEVHDRGYALELREAAIAQTESYGLWIKNQNALIEALRNEEKAFAERRRFLETRLERNENFLAEILKEIHGGKFESANVKMGFRKSESVDIVDPKLLSTRFVELKIQEMPNKSAIKEALKAGEKVEGAVLVERQHLQIK